MYAHSLDFIEIFSMMAWVRVGGTIVLLRHTIVHIGPLHHGA
jgi:hypothetical protein